MTVPAASPPEDQRVRRRLVAARAVVRVHVIHARELIAYQCPILCRSRDENVSTPLQLRDVAGFLDEYARHGFREKWHLGATVVLVLVVVIVVVHAGSLARLLES